MIKQLFDSTVEITAEAEKAMKAAAKALSAIVGTECLAIREWGVQVSDEYWVAVQGDAWVSERPGGDCDFPYEVRCVKDGVEFFSIMTAEACEKLKETMR